MSSPAPENWFETAWADREENVYRRLFGSDTRDIFTLSHTMFLETFKQPSFDPRWLHYGVIEYRPTAARPSWLYVTSGMSNAWGDDRPNPDGPSGIGCEFVLETPEQGKWAIVRLQHLMVFQTSWRMAATRAWRSFGPTTVFPFVRRLRQSRLNCGGSSWLRPLHSTRASHWRQGGSSCTKCSAPRKRRRLTRESAVGISWWNCCLAPEPFRSPIRGASRCSLLPENAGMDCTMRRVLMERGSAAWHRVSLWCGMGRRN